MPGCLRIDSLPRLVPVDAPRLEACAARRLEAIQRDLRGTPLGDGPALIAASASASRIHLYEARYSWARLICGGERGIGIGMLGVKLWLLQGGRVLWQRRAVRGGEFGRWDLAAGGGVDPGEGLIAAAVREACEELGVRAADIGDLRPLALVTHSCGVLVVVGGRLAEGARLAPNRSEVSEVALLEPGRLPGRLVSGVERTVAALA